MRLSDNPKISIVIPSYKPGKLILKCLESVHHQSLDIEGEVIVVDSSPQDVGPMIHDVFPSVRHKWMRERTLSGRARTIGAEMARGETIFFTDTDCIVSHDWLERLWEVHQQGYPVAGGSVANGTPKSIIGTTEYLLEFNEMNPWAKPREVTAHPSNNLSVEKRIFDQVGAFPDFMKGEDTIFCDNVIHAGEKIFFNPKAKILHKNREGFIHYMKNQIALGEGSIETRRRTKRHGYFLVHYPVLVPFIPVYRTYIVGKRLFLSHPKLFLQYVLLYPLIFLGLMAYTWGFIRGPHREGLSTEKEKKG